MDNPLLTEEKKSNRTFHLNNFKLTKKMSRYLLEILSNGFIVCKISISTKDRPDKFIECQALIDTGADTTLLCESIFSQLDINPDLIEKTSLSTTNADEKEILVYPLILTIPKNNYHAYSANIGITNLLHRKEYRAIIGVDFLRNVNLFAFRGMQMEAWIDV